MSQVLDLGTNPLPGVYNPLACLSPTFPLPHLPHWLSLVGLTWVLPGPVISVGRPADGHVLAYPSLKLAQMLFTALLKLDQHRGLVRLAH